MNNRFLTSTDPEFLSVQSRPTERTREASARRLAQALNAPQPQNTLFSGSVAVDPGSISANTRAGVSVTIENVAPGDFVMWNVPTGLNAGLVFSGSIVAAADTVTLYLANITGSPINDGSNTWAYMVVRLS